MKRPDYHTDLTVGFGIMQGADADPSEAGSFSGEKLTYVDNDLDNWYNPLIDAEIVGILNETDMARRNGTLRPFVEGERIGALPRRGKVRPVSDKAVRTYRNERREEQRDEMLRLRKRNDTMINALLRGIR